MESYQELKGTSTTSCGCVQASNIYENSIWPMNRKIIVRKKKGIDENPFFNALKLFQKQEKLKKLRHEKSNQALKTPVEGKKSMNIPVSSSFATQKEFCCPAKAVKTRNHDTELQKPDPIATTTTEEPIKQINSDFTTISSDNPPCDARRILTQNRIHSVTDCKITPAVLSKTGQESNVIGLGKQSPTVEGIRGSMKKFDRECGTVATESPSLSHVVTKLHQHPSGNREGQPQTGNEKPCDQSDVKELKLHKMSKEHKKDSFTADTVHRMSDLNISKKSHSQVQNSNSEHERDYKNCHEERREKSEERKRKERTKRKKDNERSDAHALLRNPQMMADEINKTLQKYYLTDRIPGKQSYCTIAKQIHKRLLKNKILDERAIREFVVAFVTGKKS